MVPAILGEKLLAIVFVRKDSGKFMTNTSRVLHDDTQRGVTRFRDGRFFVAALLTFPVLIVPIIVAASLIWQRVQFVKLHPTVVSVKPLTISKILNDPSIGEPFLLWMTVGAGLLAFAIWRICRLYLATIAYRFQASEQKKTRLGALVASACLLQAVAIVGMLMLSLNPSHTDSAAHMAGSYMLFFGQAVSILMSGFLCGAIGKAAAGAGAGDDPRSGLILRSCVFRWRFSRVIAGLAVLFWISYLGRDVPLPFEGLTMQLLFSSLESVLLASFLMYLMSFTPDLFRFEMHG